jgi:transposase
MSEPTNDILGGLREVLIIVGSGLVLWAFSTVREILRRLGQDHAKMSERIARIEERIEAVWKPRS